MKKDYKKKLSKSKDIKIVLKKKKKKSNNDCESYKKSFRR